MRIILVTMKYSYGIKERGLDYISVDGFCKTFKKLGHTVSPFYFDDYLKKTDELQGDLIQHAENFKPDLIFFILYTDQFYSKTLQFLKSRYRTVGWFGDDTWRFENYSKNFACDFLFCVTTDRLSVQKYREIGQNNIILSQWAAIDAHSVAKTGIYKYDVSFIGGYSESRNWFIEELKKRGIEVTTFGQGWKNGPLTESKMNKLFGETKINLNLSNSMSFDARYLKFKLSSMRHKTLLKMIVKSKGNPGTFFRQLTEEKNFGQMKARHFEIPYFGGFQMSYYYCQIADYFSIGKEIICFSDIDEAAALIQYYLVHSAERERVKAQGIRRARKEHGYVHRLRAILAHIRAS